MPDITKTKGLTYGELRDIASGKSKRKLTIKEQEQVKRIQEQTKRFAENFLPKIPDISALSSIIKTAQNPLADLDTSWIRSDMEAKAEQRALTKAMLADYRAKQQSQPINPVFDFAKSEIRFAGKIIKISKGTNEYNVCRAVFSDPTKDWSWDEIVEKWGENPEMKNWRVIYNAANEVNIKVAIETGIKDLLSVKTKVVSLNPQYIKI